MAWTLFAVATLALVALAVPATLYVRRTVPEPVVTRLDVVTPPTTDAFSFALSPDGRQLVFVANGEKGPQLWVRPLDQTTAQPLANTEGASFPFWAPDGRAVGFFADGKLKRINLTGGAVQVLADAPLPRGGTWNADGVIVFAPTSQRRTHAGGGERWGRCASNTARVGTRQPSLATVFAGWSSIPLFDGDWSAADAWRLYRLARRWRADAGHASRDGAVYAAPGYLLLVSQGVLAAYPFDAARATVAGEPIPVAQAVGTDDGTFHSAFSVRNRACWPIVQALAPSGDSSGSTAWVRCWAKSARSDENALANPELAPDGQRIALNRTVQGNVDVWLLEAGRGVPNRFTFDAALDARPHLVA